MSQFLLGLLFLPCRAMALRRPPTRIELKTDDIDEYEEVIVELLLDCCWIVVELFSFLHNVAHSFFVPYPKINHQILQERREAAEGNCVSKNGNPSISSPPSLLTNPKPSVADRIGLNRNR
jgi:Anaphase-promoting complex APC subunit CDC26